MQVRLLGALDVVVGDRTVALGGPKERLVLAVLAVSANKPVSEYVLAEAVWGDEPPRTASKTLRSYVSRLRTSLASAELEDGMTAVTIESSTSGYTLRVGAGGLDIDEVASLLDHARDAVARGDHSWAAVAFGQALRAWRGPSLADFADDAFARVEARRLDDLRESVIEARIDAELECGQHATVAGELAALTAAHPLRERFWAQRMIALYRCGRQADALRAYQDLRTLLVDEMGLEPSPAVVALEQEILRQDPALDWHEAAPEEVEPGVDLPSGVVTFLLTDIVESTVLWEGDSAAMAEALSMHDTLISRVVTLAGGRLLKAKGEGDATMSVFRRPSDAVATAFALNRELTAQSWPGDLHLTVRIALHTGEAFERDQDYFGPTLNRSARIRSLATGGEVLLSQATAELVMDRLPDGATLVDRGLYELRGLAREERVFELRRSDGDAPAATGAPDAFTIALPASLVPHGVFLGRGPELAALRSLWSTASGGACRAALLAGEPGIGKTRLATSIASEAHVDGGVALFGRCDQDLGVPYQPFAAALAHFVSECPPAQRRTSIGPLGGELVHLLPDLATQVPGLPAPTRADPETERHRLFEAVAAWLSAASQLAPVALVLDDLHWATTPTLLMLRHVLRSELPMSLLILGTYRDTELDRQHALSEMLTDLRREGVVERIGLDGLDESGTTDVVEAAAGRELAEGELVLARRLHRQTGGNPFFIREVMRHLAETGAFYEVDGDWVVDASSVEIGLPEGVRDVITRRLSRMSDEANRALSVASIVGATFSLGLLERVSEAADDASTLLDALDEAVRARLIMEVREKPGHYVFAHALIRQTLDSELSSARRARMHRRIGEAIEMLPDAAIDVEALAFHFSEAALDGQVAKATDYALAAGRRAIERLAYEEAVMQLERGLATLELDLAPDTDRRADLFLALATGHWSVGERSAAHKAAVNAAADARRSGSPERLAQAAVLLAGFSVSFVEDPAVEPACEAALAALADTNPVSRSRVLAGLARYQMLSMADGDLARRTSDEALRLARAGDNPSVLLAALYARGIALYGSPNFEEHLDVSNETVDVARRVGDIGALCDALISRLGIKLAVADLTGLEEDLDEAVELAARDQSGRRLVFTSAARAGLATLKGQFAEAAGHIERMTDEIGDDLQAFVLYVASEGILLREKGDVVELLRLASAALERMPSIRALPPTMAGFHALVGDNATALETLDWSVADDLAKVPQDWVLMCPLIFLAEAAALLGSAPHAAELERHLLPFAGHVISLGQSPISLGAVDRYLGMLAAAQEHWDEAESRFLAALELDHRINADIFVARTSFWYASMLISRGADGDASKAGQLFGDALAIADKFGIADVADRCRAALAS